MNVTILEVWKRGSLFYHAALFLPELVLLTVAGIPDVINSKIWNNQKNNEPP